MEAWAVMRLDGPVPTLDVVWPTKAQAEQSAGFCSYPVKVVPVSVEGLPVSKATS